MSEEAMDQPLKSFTVVTVAVYREDDDGPDDCRMQSFTLRIKGASAADTEKAAMVMTGDVLRQEGCDWEYVFVAAIFEGHHETVDTESGHDMLPDGNAVLARDDEGPSVFDISGQDDT